MKFTGLSPLPRQPGQIDFTLDTLGHVDLRNDAHVTAIRFVPGVKHMSIFLDFSRDRDDRSISIEFTKAELCSVEPYLETGVDPMYGFSLLRGLDYWLNSENGREGFGVSTITLDLEFYSEEMRVLV